MALADLAAFSAQFPEFARVIEESEPQVEGFLNLAAVSVAAPEWGDFQLEGHLQLTAHMLASSPYGQAARLEPGADTRTTYGERYDDLREMVACGTRVF